MLVRIVKMHFQPEKVESFLDLFEKNKMAIRSFEGCLSLELLRDQDNPAAFATLSHWKGPEHLETYRKSALFRQVWPATKKLFSHPPEATSYSTDGMINP